MNKVAFLERLAKKSATKKLVGPEIASHHASPWAWRDNTGVYVGKNGQAWLYNEIHPSANATSDKQLETFLAALALARANEKTGALVSAVPRDIHILTTTYDSMVKVENTTRERLRGYIEAALDFPVPKKALFIGVQLLATAEIPMKKARLGSNLAAYTREVTSSLLGESVPDIESFEADRFFVQRLLTASGAAPLSGPSLGQLQSWFNDGSSPDATFVDTRQSLYANQGSDRLEFCALDSFDKSTIFTTTPEAISSLTTRVEGTSLISARGVLKPQIINKKQVDQKNVDKAILNRVSIVFGRRTQIVNETYLDQLINVETVSVKSLEHRQLAALDETLPTSDSRVSPFLLEVSVEMLSSLGMGTQSTVGDTQGFLLGLADPDYAPIFIDPSATSAAGLPPTMLILGDAKTGKSFTAQNIAVQSTLSGVRTCLINVEGYKMPLRSMVELLGGELVPVSAISSIPGAFDPFRFAKTPLEAAEIATTFILSILGAGTGPASFDEKQGNELAAGLRRGALNGAGSVGDAMESVLDLGVLKAVKATAAASPLFALAIGTGKLSPIQNGAGITVIEFDAPLDLPSRGVATNNYTSDNRIAIATINHLSQMSLNILRMSGGGTLILDDAWPLLNSPVGASIIRTVGVDESMKNIFQVLVTDRVHELVENSQNLISYFSRVLTLKLADEKDAQAALILSAIEATPQRVEWLKPTTTSSIEDAKSVHSRGVFKDSVGLVTAVILGPVPREAHQALTPKSTAAKLVV